MWWIWNVLGLMSIILSVILCLYACPTDIQIGIATTLFVGGFVLLGIGQINKRLEAIEKWRSL